MSKLKRMVKVLLGKKKRKKRSSEEVKKLYSELDYLDAYSAHTDMRVARNPLGAVGGRWEEMGNLQLDFLVREGLLPHHRMLDIGCGTLRGGRKFIGYLEAENYSGLDISPKAIEFARQVVLDEGLSKRQPRLLVSEKNLRFEEFRGETFDYILAQSVFTHLKEEHIAECFEHIGSIMTDASRFYFTYRKIEAPKQIGMKSFGYPFSTFESLGDRHGFVLEDCSAEYAHPTGQSMVKLQRR